MSLEDNESAWLVEYEEVEWNEPPDPTASRRERLRSRGTYQAAVLPTIAENSIDLDPTVEAEAAEALAELARFDADMASSFAGEFSPLPAVLLRSESSSSSQIEQITSGAKALALASLGEETGPNAQLVNSNAEAMNTALALADEVSSTTIIDVHSALVKRSHPEYAGQFREGPVWIGGRGSTPHTANFVPPQASRVPELIEDMVSFTQRTDINPFVQIAVTHAQFETIHPFPDGNGRTGRALAHAMLRHYGVTRQITVPVSAGLLARVGDYYEALNSYRDGDLNPIVSEFTRAAFEASRNGRELAKDMAQIRDEWMQRINARRDAAVWRAIPVVMAQPAVTVNYLSNEMGIAYTTAQVVIDQLSEAGALSPSGSRKRDRVWSANEVVDALDDFSKRVGKRQKHR